MLWKENNDKRPCLTFKISSLGFISHCLFVRQHWSLPVITIMENCSLLEMMAVLNRDSPPQTAPAATTSQGKATSFSKQARTEQWKYEFHASGSLYFAQSLIFLCIHFKSKLSFSVWGAFEMKIWQCFGCILIEMHSFTVPCYGKHEIA